MINAQRQKCHEPAEAKTNLWFLVASQPADRFYSVTPAQSGWSLSGTLSEALGFQDNPIVMAFNATIGRTHSFRAAGRVLTQPVLFVMRILDSRLRGNDTADGLNRVFASGTQATVEVKTGFAEEDSAR